MIANKDDATDNPAGYFLYHSIGYYPGKAEQLNNAMHEFSAIWGAPDAGIHKISEYDADGPFSAWNWLKLGEHSGTHFDSPHHWISGKDFPDGFTNTLDVQRLIASVNVIDCSENAAADADFLFTAKAVKAWEDQFGEIGPCEWVVMRTDWDKRAHDEALFLNEGPDPHEDGSRSPGPTPECIDYLLSKGIVGWGTQCIATDAGVPSS